MELLTNDFTVVFANKAVAERAKQIAIETLNSLSFDMYSYNPAKRYADSLRLEENEAVGIPRRRQFYEPCGFPTA